jgi:hypothetical protein
MDMLDALAFQEGEEPIVTVYKVILSKHVALLELLVAKGIITQDETDILVKREQHWLAHYDQLDASRHDELLRRKTPEGEEARVQDAFKYANAGGGFDPERFAARYAELGRLVEEKKEDGETG